MEALKRNHGKISEPHYGVDSKRPAQNGKGGYAGIMRRVVRHRFFPDQESYESSERLKRKKGAAPVDINRSGR